MSKFIEVDTTVEVDLREIDTEILVEELRYRDFQFSGIVSELSTDFLLNDKEAIITKVRELVINNGYPV